jgi:hypothetical protein
MAKGGRGKRDAWVNGWNEGMIEDGVCLLWRFIADGLCTAFPRAENG